MTRFISIFFLLISLTTYSQGQSDKLKTLDYTQAPKEYEIGGIKIEGAKYTDEKAIASIAGLKVGNKIRIPGTVIPRAMKALWKLKLFADINIYQEKTIGDVVFLIIAVEEVDRLTSYSFLGVKKGWHDDLNSDLKPFLIKGGIISKSAKANALKVIHDFLKGKGYYDSTVSVKEVKDKKRKNGVKLDFNIKRGKKVKIENITFSGNTNTKARKLRKSMENTHRRYKLFSGSKLVQPDYETDKLSILSYYNTLGFKDATIQSDSIWRNEKGRLRIHINIDEGHQYFFRQITWKGNSIYDEETLSSVLGIKKGDIYNEDLLNTRLNFSQDNRDVSSLYMDNGYLFFRVDPTEIAIENDSIDLEIRITEGPQASIDKVTIAGNDRTHEHVIQRELRTKPGKKFSRSDLIRSQREIINLGYFNPEALNINTPVNPQRGTVDIEYTLEEKPSDQLELSAGWGGASQGLIGTLGMTFNNFSVRNILKKETWSPLPQGDGQKLSIRAQRSSTYYQSYNMSFTEPWLGGKKPTSLTMALYYNLFKQGTDSNSEFFRKFGILTGTVGVGTRLKWPDDNFIGRLSLNLQQLTLQNWTSFTTPSGELISKGSFKNFSLEGTIARSSVNDPIFPKTGSTFSLTGKATLPYSSFRKKDYYNNLTVEQRLEYVEYYKIRFNAEWYTQLFGKFVLKSAAKIGFVGAYSQKVGLSPFELYQLGGDALSNQSGGGFQGIDRLALRGYEQTDLHPTTNDSAPVFSKYTMELRYPISLNPSSTIYILAFAEAGNVWGDFKTYNPFDVKRSVGAGLRVFLPMFGTLGFDYGFGLDKNIPVGSKAKEYGKLTVILGFEPE